MKTNYNKIMTQSINAKEHSILNSRSSYMVWSEAYVYMQTLVPEAGI